MKAANVARRTTTRLLLAVLALSGAGLALANADPFAKVSGTVEGPVHPQGQTATLLSDGRWLLVGGYDKSGAPTDGVAFAAPGSAQGNLETPLHLQQARARHTTTLLPDGSLLVFGGHSAEGRTLASAESIDVAGGVIASIRDMGLIPRRNHSATLLTNGMVLIAGGVGEDGLPIVESELWDPKTRTVSPFIASLNSARSQHQAALLANGKGLVWGGVDGQGQSPAQADLYDPVQRIFQAVDWWDDSKLNSPGQDQLLIEETLPAANDTKVPVDAQVAVRFSRRIDVTSAQKSSVTLLGPSGIVAGKVVATEQGRLVFFTPDVELWPASTYTLFLKGVRDGAGNELPFSAVSFTTRSLTNDSVDRNAGRSSAASIASAASRAGLASELSGASGPWAQGGSRKPSTKDNRNKDGEEEDEDSEDWIPGPQHRSGDWRFFAKGAAPFKLFDQAASGLSAPAGKTAVAGRVRKLNGRPLVNVPVALGGASAVTDSSGRFLLVGVPAGRQDLLINGEQVQSKGRHYGRHYVGVDVIAGKTNMLPKDVYLSRINPSHEIAIPSPTTSEVVLTHPLIPGMEIRLPKGTIIRDAAGRIVTKLSITPVPVDRAPTDVPAVFPVYFTIQPAGAVIENNNPTALRAVQVLYPNYGGLPAGQVVDFYNYDTKRGWYVYGQGRVTDDGKQATPDPGVGEYTVMPFGFGIGSKTTPASEWPPVQSCETGGANPEAGDPVNCATGLFLHRVTDISIPDVIPLNVTRVYRQKDTVSRDFGIGANHNYSMFLYSPGAEASNPNEVDLILPDGGRVHYTLYSDSSGNVWKHFGSPSPFYGSELRMSQASDAYELTLRDKTVLFFTDHSPNLFLGMRDVNGNTITVSRATDNAPIGRVTSSNGRYLDFTYDTAKRITKITDNIGRYVAYEYDTSGRLWKVTDQAGKVEQYAYDSSHRMTSVVDRRGNTMVTNEYDTNGRVAKQTLADGAIWQFAYTITNAKVTQTKITDPRNSIRVLSFNTAGYITQEVLGQGTAEQQTIVYERGTDNLLKSVTDALSRKTTFTYDGSGRIKAVTRLSGTADAVTDTYAYTSDFGRVSSYTDPLSHTTKFGYDSLGNLTSVTDSLDHITRVAVNGQGLPIAVTNALSRTTQIAYQQGDIASVTDPLSRKVSIFTDGVGRVMSVTDPLSNRTRYDYDLMDRALQVTDALGGVTVMTYDANGNVLSVRDPRNLASHGYAYDKRNRLQTYTDPLGKTDSYTYDGMGNLKSRTDRNLQTTSYDYDALNRLTKITYPGSTVTIAWDAGNRPTKLVDSANGTITLAYDLLDRLISESGPQGAVSYSYDAAGRRTQMTVASGTAITYAYDNANRLTSITQGTSKVSFAYDNANRRTSLTLPNGIVGTYSYSTADELTGISYAKGTTTVGAITYTYDSAGRRISRSSTIDTSGLPTAISSATYDAANKLTQWGSKALTYNSDGSLKSDGSLNYTWNGRGQLASISGTTTASFGYDGFGRRRTKTVSGTKTDFHYDGLNIVRELNGTTVLATSLTGLGLDEAITRTEGSTTSSYLADALGSIVALTDANGAKTTTYGYDAYGNTTATGTASTNKLQYTGRENDGTGLNYLRARYYSPQLHRFISSDPIGLDGGINTYAYVGGNPISYVDPEGLSGVAVVAARPPIIPRQLIPRAGETLPEYSARLQELRNAEAAQWKPEILHPITPRAIPKRAEDTGFGILARALRQLKGLADDINGLVADPCGAEKQQQEAFDGCVAEGLCI